MYAKPLQPLFEPVCSQKQVPLIHKHRLALSQTLVEIGTAHPMDGLFRQRSHELCQGTYDRRQIGFGTFPCADQFTTIQQKADGSVTASKCYATLSVSTGAPRRLHNPQTVQTCQNGEIAVGPDDFGAHNCSCSKVQTD